MGGGSHTVGGWGEEVIMAGMGMRLIINESSADESEFSEKLVADSQHIALLQNCVAT